jgi:hypothetical protein
MSSFSVISKAPDRVVSPDNYDGIVAAYTPDGRRHPTVVEVSKCSGALHRVQLVTNR